MRLVFFSLLFFLIFIENLRAQEEIDSLVSFSIDSVVVYSSRYSIPLDDTPFSIDIIDEDFLENISNPLSVEEAIGHQPGIIVNNRTNLAQGDKLSIRGIGTRSQFGVRGIKIFLDGIPLTFTDGQSQLNNLNTQEIESAEILKGPSSVLYGNSLGGVILLKSASIDGSDFNLKPNITIGSYGFKKYGISSGIKIGENINTSLSAYYTESKGYREHSDSRFYGINLISRFSPSEKFSINIVSNFYNAPYLLNPSSLNKEDAKENPESVRGSVLNFATSKKVTQFQNGIGLEYILSKKSKIRTSIYWVIRDLDNSIPGRIIDLKRNFGGIRTEFDHDFSLSGFPVKLLAGIDHEFQFDDRKEFKNKGIPDISNIDPSTIFDELEYSDILISQEENAASLGGFLHLNFQPIKKIKLFAGLRYDNVSFEVKDLLSSNAPEDISMNSLSYMTGFNYKIADNATAFGNFSSGFQTPTTNELSNNPMGRGFNKELDPEKVNNYELGIKSFIKKLNLFGKFSLFKMDFSNLLIGYQSATEEIFYRNAGKAENLGVEAIIEFLPLPDLKLTTSYTYMNFIFTDYVLQEEINERILDFQLRDNFVPGVPRNSSNLIIQYSGVSDFQSRLIFTYSDQYFTNDFNGPSSPDKGNKSEYINDSYIKIDLILNYFFDLFIIPMSIGFKAENINDARYNGSIIPNAFGKNFFEPAAGRSYYLNIGINF